MSKVKVFLRYSFVIVLIAIFAFSTISLTANVSFAETVKSQKEEQGTSYNTSNNVYNKIHFYLGDESHSTISDFNELKTVTTELKTSKKYAVQESNMMLNSNISPITKDENLNLTVQFDSDFTQTEQYLKFAEERENIQSLEELHEFRERLNAYSKDYHEDLINANIDKLSKLSYTEIEKIDYSPFAVLSVPTSHIDAESLSYIAQSSSVISLSVAREEHPATTVSWNNTLSEINAYNIVSNGTYTGKGVRIGVYESGGVCDKTHKNLKGKNITLRSNDIPVTSHATQVVSVIAIMAPDATFFVSDVNRMGISWFIENKCDVVNCSFAYLNNYQKSDGTYVDGEKVYRDDIDGIYDYQIATHFISVVAAAGNNDHNNRSDSYNPNDKVTSPALGYNVIAVGGVKRTLSWFTYVLNHDSGAAYAASEPRVKPNISAIFTVNIPNIGVCNGTSYSAPQVTACIALLADRYPSYLGYPERIMSVITSTAKKTNDYSTTVGQFDSKVGAGVIDLQKMMESSYSISKHHSTGSALSEVVGFEMSLTKGQDIQVALSWLAFAQRLDMNLLSIKKVHVTDYDLRIYQPSGNYTSSSLTLTNVEMLRYTAPESGSYRIVIYQWGERDKDNYGDWMSLTISK